MINFEIFTEHMDDLHGPGPVPQGPGPETDEAIEITREAFQSLQDEVIRQIQDGMHPYQAFQSLAEGLNWHLN